MMLFSRLIIIMLQAKTLILTINLTMEEKTRFFLSEEEIKEIDYFTNKDEYNKKELGLTSYNFFPIAAPCVYLLNLEQVRSKILSQVPFADMLEKAFSEEFFKGLGKKIKTTPNVIDIKLNIKVKVATLISAGLDGIEKEKPNKDVYMRGEPKNSEFSSLEDLNDYYSKTFKPTTVEKTEVFIESSFIASLTIDLKSSNSDIAEERFYEGKIYLAIMFHLSEDFLKKFEEDFKKANPSFNFSINNFHFKINLKDLDLIMYGLNKSGFRLSFQRKTKLKVEGLRSNNPKLIIEYEKVGEHNKYALVHLEEYLALNIDAPVYMKRLFIKRLFNGFYHSKAIAPKTINSVLKKFFSRMNIE